jgi:hypothetical protein
LYYKINSKVPIYIHLNYALLLLLIQENKPTRYTRRAKILTKHMSNAYGGKVQRETMNMDREIYRSSNW